MLAEELKQTKTILLIVVTLVAVIAAGVAWYREQHPTLVSKAQFVNVDKIKAVAKIKTAMVPVKEVSTIDKTAVVEKLKLSDDVAKDENKQITTTGEIHSYEGNTNVVTVLDTKTGESNIIAKQQPLSFFDFENKKEIGVRYGTTIKTGIEADVYGRWDFLRVGNVHLGLYAEANSLGEGKAMISAGYRW